MPSATHGGSIRIRLVRQSSMDRTSVRRINAEGAIVHGVNRGRSPHQQPGSLASGCRSPRREHLPPWREWRLAGSDATYLRGSHRSSTRRASPLRSASCKEMHWGSPQPILMRISCTVRRIGCAVRQMMSFMCPRWSGLESRTPLELGRVKVRFSLLTCPPLPRYHECAWGSRRSPAPSVDLHFMTGRFER